MKVTVIGSEFNEGISKKTGKPYAMASIYGTARIVGNDNARGFMAATYQTTPEVVRTIDALPYPFEAELETEVVMRYGQSQTLVTAVRPVGLPAIAAVRPQAAAPAKVAA